MLAMGVLVLMAKIPPKSRLHGFRGLGLPQRINRHESFRLPRLHAFGNYSTLSPQTMLYLVLAAAEPVWLSGLRVVAIAGLESRIIRTYMAPLKIHLEHHGLCHAIQKSSYPPVQYLVSNNMLRSSGSLVSKPHKSSHANKLTQTPRIPYSIKSSVKKNRQPRIHSGSPSTRGIKPVEKLLVLTLAMQIQTARNGVCASMVALPTI